MGLEPVAKVPVSQWLDYNTWRRELGAAIFYVPRGLRKEDWGKGDRGRACPLPHPRPSSDPSCGLAASPPLASRGPPSRLIGDCPLLLKLGPAADWRLLPKEARASGPRGRRAGPWSPGPALGAAPPFLSSVSCWFHLASWTPTPPSASPSVPQPVRCQDPWLLPPSFPLPTFLV